MKCPNCGYTKGILQMNKRTYWCSDGCGIWFDKTQIKKEIENG